jgi:hypothetical protein
MVWKTDPRSSQFGRLRLKMLPQSLQFRTARQCNLPSYPYCTVTRTMWSIAKRSSLLMVRFLWPRLKPISSVSAHSHLDGWIVCTRLHHLRSSRLWPTQREEELALNVRDQSHISIKSGGIDPGAKSASLRAKGRCPIPWCVRRHAEEDDGPGADSRVQYERSPCLPY